MLRAPRRLAVLASLAVSAAVLPVLSAPAAAVSPDVVINEVYGGGGNSGATYRNDFIELRNLSAAPVSLDGWSVQYASASGTSWQRTALSGSIPANGYYLVQQAQGSGGTTALPTPDATGTIALSGTSGKVALTTTSASCTGTDCGLAAGNPALRDFVGYGSANASEGGTPAPAPSNTTSTARTAGDTDRNGADFATGDPTPQNAASSPPASGPAVPVATCPSDQTVDVGTSRDVVATARDADSRITAATVTATRAQDATQVEDSIALSSFAASPAAGDTATATIRIAADTPVGSYDVDVRFSTDDDPAQTGACDVTVTVRDPSAVTRISQIQGSGASSPMTGSTVDVEAVVTSLLERSDVLDGFFVQEQARDQDADPTTSEGLFVFCRAACPADLAAGDQVRLTGVVTEFQGTTQLDVTQGTVTVLSRANPLPTATDVALPAGGSTRDAATFEPVESMLVRFPAELAVSEYFQLAQYGQLTLTAGGRPYQYSHTARPTPEGYAAHLAELDTRRIYLDDDNNDQNDAISGPDADEPYAYPSGGLSTTNRFRGGDTITGLTGVLHWSFSGGSTANAWRVRPVPGQQYAFERENPRPAAPDAVGGRLRAASFNVLNYFTTVDTTSSSSSGPCGPSGTMDCRGADSAAELERQRVKVVDALARIDADVVGLIEIQNDADASLADLVAALNADGRAGTYDYVRTGVIGGDAIKVAFIYRPARVSPVGAFQVLDASDDPRFIDDRNRPALVQSFREVATGEVFTAAINHFKSKGSACGDDPDRNDGAGNCNVTRTQAARALADFLAKDPTGSGDPDALILGDLNAYKNEDPIVALESAGYTDLIEKFVGDGAYGYVFDGQLGYLDHALANAALLGQVTGATEWHANADEPVLLDYNDDVRDAGEASFERESTSRLLYEPNAYRSSDHDAVVVGLALRSGSNAPPADPGPPPAPAPASPSASASATPSASASATASARPSASAGATSSPAPTGSVPQAACAVPARVTLHDRVITATGSARLTVHGTPSSVVDLYAYTQPSRTFRVVRTAELGADGAAEFRIVPPANTRLYAQQRGCSPTDAATQSVVLNVRTALSLAATRAGRLSYAFSGDSLPARPGGLVVSLFRVSGSGRHVLTAQTRADAATGRWRLERRFTGSGRHLFVARTGQDLLNAPGASNVRPTLLF